MGAIISTDHHHSAVVQVGYALAGFLALLHDVHPKLFAWEHNRLKCIGEFVYVEDLDALKPGYAI